MSTVDRSVLDITASVFHSNVSTAVAKNVSLLLSLPPSVGIQGSDIDVVVTPEGVGNLVPRVVATENVTTLTLDIGDLPSMADLNLDLLFELLFQSNFLTVDTSVTINFGIPTDTIKDIVSESGFVSLLVISKVLLSEL